MKLQGAPDIQTILKMKITFGKFNFSIFKLSTKHIIIKAIYKFGHTDSYNRIENSEMNTFINGKFI